MGGRRGTTAGVVGVVLEETQRGSAVSPYGTTPCALRALLSPAGPAAAPVPAAGSAAVMVHAYAFV